MTAQEALLRYARELDRQVELVKSLLEGRRKPNPAVLLAHHDKMADKLDAVLRALEGK